MSLLIKALDKAQNAKAEELQAQNIKAEQAKVEQAKAAKKTPSEKTEAIINTDSAGKRTGKPQATAINNGNIELSLSPSENTFSANIKPENNVPIVALTPDNLLPPVIAKPLANAPAKPATPQANSFSAPSASAKIAANVFSAKGVESNKQNTSLALIAGAGLITLLGMGLYFYQFVDSTPDVFVPPPRPAIEQTITAIAQPTINSVEPSQIDMPAEAADSEQAMQPADVQESLTKQEATIKKVAKKQDAMQQEVINKEDFDEAVAPEETVMVADNSEDILDSSASLKAKKMRQSKNKATTASTIASDSASIQVSKSSPQASINPILMSAYDAYNAGNDKDAIKLYKQVLQRDVRNIDALLGMGAIASRQGRMADANGWYGKVLELDPRNNIALTARLDSQSQGNEQGNETRLKNMLAKQPNDANLHVALGNLYAEQNQWPAAQQAYFDAYSLNKTADNAFNLAISLDQMGKPKLALPYYQRALEQIDASSSIDRAALEARIVAIQ